MKLAVQLALGAVLYGLAYEGDATRHESTIMTNVEALGLKPFFRKSPFVGVGSLNMNLSRNILHRSQAPLLLLEDKSSEQMLHIQNAEEDNIAPGNHVEGARNDPIVQHVSPPSPPPPVECCVCMNEISEDGGNSLECGHKNQICSGCAETMLQQAHNERTQAKCPLCRGSFGPDNRYIVFRTVKQIMTDFIDEQLKLILIGTPDYHRILGDEYLPPFNVIRRAYRRQAMLLHPDKNVGADDTTLAENLELMQKLNVGWAIIESFYNIVAGNDNITSIRNSVYLRRWRRHNVEVSFGLNILAQQLQDELRTNLRTSYVVVDLSDQELNYIFSIPTWRQSLERQAEVA